MEIRAMLAPGRRALDKGRVCDAVDLIVRQPRRLASVVKCLWDEDEGVACRAADVLERLTAAGEHAHWAVNREPRVDPRRLAPWKDSLLGLISEAAPKKLRWNLAFVVPRMELTVAEARRVANGLNVYLYDSSSIVKTAAMHGLATLTRWDSAMLPGVVDMLRTLSRSGTPAMRARGRILLKKLESKSWDVSF